MAIAKAEGEKSSDWWRQVGALVVKDGRIITTHNQHLPHEYSPYMHGDPRDVIKAGTESHLTNALHAEQALVSIAARDGISLRGASLYVSLFPCPMCANTIAMSGIAKCYFADGHASLSGAEVMKRYGVQLIHVQ